MPLGFWRTILSVVVGSMGGGMVVRIIGKVVGGGCAGDEVVGGELICLPPFAYHQQEGRMEVVLVGNIVGCVGF